MKVDVVLGLQWGDEGKGKIVDLLAERYPVVARFQGGPNAGHSLQFNNTKTVLHTIPSGIFREGSVNIIGNGVVIDPLTFKEECNKLHSLGVDARERIFISKKAHLILPTHRAIDLASEKSKGSEKIGSTLKGIGPVYIDKIGRNGLRVGDILSDNFLDRFKTLKNKHRNFLKQFSYTADIDEGEREWMEAVEFMKTFHLIDTEYFIREQAAEGKSVLAEGAQGSLLDIDFGTYPFVTSSNTVSGGACTGLGISPKEIGKVMGIFKAYCTRVGSGPFPTELHDQTGELLREKGREFGATTGRARRTGWLDLVALKYAVMINGVESLIMMKGDVLDSFESIKVATSYKIGDQTTKEYPFETQSNIEPIYDQLKGWKKDLTKVTKKEELPNEFIEFINFIEEEVGVPIAIVSLGPDREQTVFYRDF
ncbi:MAG: adenylosuccinate synthase [Bacteroidales bacterium]